MIQMSDASLWSHWQEFGRKTTLASQLQPPVGQCSCLMLPVGGERGIGQGRRSGCTQLHPLPYSCAQRGRGLKEPREELLASLAGEVSSKLRTLAAASCAACQNLLWGLSQTNFVQQ